MRAIHSSLVLLLLSLFVSTGTSQWIPVSSPSMIGSGPYSNQGAMAYADGVAWAGLYDIYRSDDRGSTWTKVASPWRTLGGYIIWISFLDRDNGCVCGENGLLITHDGGATWSKNFWGKNIFCAAFLGNDKNLVVGNRPDYTVEISHDGGSTWKTLRLTNNALLKDLRLYEPGHVIGFVEYAYDKGNASAVVESTDFGETWRTFAGRTDPDSHSFEVLRCDHSLVIGINEEVGNYVGQDGAGEINRSTDGGATFKTILTRGNGVIRGSVVATPGVIYVPSSPAQFLESQDEGATWASVSGPSFPSDSHGLIAIDDTTLLAADQKGTIYRRIDPRGAVAVNASDPGISPSVLTFAKPLTPCSTPDTLLISIARSCATADVRAMTILSDPSFSASRIGDVIHIVFTPDVSGTHQADLKLTFTNGRTATIPMTATVHESARPTFSTANVQTDTIGATVYVPVRIRTQFDLDELRLSIGYDTTDLEYAGATFDTLPTDLTESVTLAHASIRVPTVTTDTANVVWIAFRYFPTEECTTVSIDSLAYLSRADGVCAFDTTMTALICAPPNCNQRMLSHYVRYRNLTLADVHFSQAAHALIVRTMEGVPDATISIYSVTGDLVYRTARTFQSASSAQIALPVLASGVYVAEIGFNGRYQSLRFEYLR